LYDDLYEELITFNNTLAVQPENSSSNQSVISSSQIQSTEIREDAVHQRQDLLFDDFLKNKFKVIPESGSESK